VRIVRVVSSIERVGDFVLFGVVGAGTLACSVISFAIDDVE